MGIVGEMRGMVDRRECILFWMEGSEEIKFEGDRYWM